MSEKSTVAQVDDEDNESVASGSMGATAVSNVNKPNYPGPNPNVKYPLIVIYCGGRFCDIYLNNIEILNYFNAIYK